jgi:hypothetical protein
MIRKVVGVVTAGLVLAAGLMAADDPTKGKVKLTPASLSVQGKRDPKQFPFAGGSVSASFLASCPGKYLLKLDRAKCKVEEFSDDKGASFLGGFLKPNFNLMSFSTGRQVVEVYLSSTAGPPSKGMTKVNIKGTVALVYGVDEKTTEATKVAMKMNTEVKSGDFTIKVTREKGFGTSGAGLTVSSKRPFKSVSIKDADGKEIEAFKSTPSTSFAGLWTSYIDLNKVHAEAKISVTYFAKEETLEIPVDLSFGLGL